MLAAARSIPKSAIRTRPQGLVAALVAVLAVGDGVEKFARDQIERNSDVQTVVVRTRSFREMDGIRVPVENPVDFAPADVDGILEIVPGASSVRWEGRSTGSRVSPSIPERVR